MRWKERDDLTTRILRAREARVREIVAKAKNFQDAKRLIAFFNKGMDEEEELELDDIMDLDLSPESSEDGESNVEDVQMRNGNLNGQYTSNSSEHEASQSTASTDDQQGEGRGIQSGNGNHHTGSGSKPMRNGDNHIENGNHHYHMANGNNQISNGQTLFRNGDDQNGNHRVSNGANHGHSGEHGLENGNYHMGNGNGQVENGNPNGHCTLKRKWSDEEAESQWETLTVNHEGEEDPDGLTQKDWDLAIGMDQALEIREGAPMEEVVRETVLWAIDVHKTGQRWKRERSHENDDDEPVHRRIGQIRRTW